MGNNTPTNYRDPDRGFRIWNRDEIVSEGGSGQWVPNIGDLVFDRTQGFLEVTAVDITTGRSTLVPWSAPAHPDFEYGKDILIGSGPGYPSESYRAFLDTSVTPHTLAPDRRLRFYGSMVASYKVFLGADISDAHGTVVSTFFDNSGNFLGSSIPVEAAEVGDSPQSVIKAPMVGYCDRPLADGELVTLVAYDDVGGVVSIAQLLIKNTAAIRQVDAGTMYVQGIAIESPFLSDADPQTIEFPINVTVQSLPMTGIVHYSNGDKYRLPIDGGKFSLFGMENYIATVVGQTFDLVLNYNLAVDEVSYNQAPTANGKLTVPYKAKTVRANGAYTVKLYMYPTWVNATQGYRMEYWLYNLDRKTYYNVTPYVELGVNSNPFDPLNYGVTQTITIALDLNRVDGTFAPYRHVQTYQVALLSRGDEPNHANWQITFTPDQHGSYGRNMIADLQFVNTNFWNLRLANGFPSQETWLQNMYQGIEPLYNEETEAHAPDPTHFRVVFNNNTYEFEISQWNEILVVNNDLTPGKLVYIQWIRRTPISDLQLGVSAVPVRIRGPQ